MSFSLDRVVLVVPYMHDSNFLMNVKMPILAEAVDPSVLLAAVDDLRHEPSGEIRKAEFFEFAFAVEGIDCFERVIQRSAMVGRVQVKDFDRVDLQSLQRRRQLRPDRCLTCVANGSVIGA